MVFRRRPDKIGGDFANRARQTRRLTTQAPLGYSSISEGSLRIASNEGLIVQGSAKVEGWLIVTGTERVTGLLEILGTLRAAGVIEFTGPVTITGATSIEGETTISGDTDIAGDVELNGKITIPGDEPITLESVGGVAMIVAGGGRLRGASDGINLQAPGGGSVFAAAGAIMGAGLTMGSNQIGVYPDGVRVFGADSVPASAVQQWAGFIDGVLVKVDASTGGPTGTGLLRWPFPLTTVSKEFDTTDPIYTPPGHRGIDFAIAGGTPIPAAGAGTVEGVGNDSERGYFVILNHGTRDGKVITTRYYHLQEPSPLVEGAAIAKGDTVGLVGTTGTSTGNHLHWETRYDGVAENPRAVMSIYGE